MKQFVPFCTLIGLLLLASVTADAQVDKDKPSRKKSKSGTPARKRSCYGK